MAEDALLRTCPLSAPWLNMADERNKATLRGVHIASYQSTLLLECQVMLDHALKTGQVIDVRAVAPLDRPDDTSPSELLAVYNHLVEVVKPASPGTLLLFEESRQSTSWFTFLGPLLIVRQFMMAAIVALATLLGMSLTPHLNNETIQLSLLEGSGLHQVVRLMFLLAASAVGASFYALFKMNSYISEGTFDTKYASTYWSRFVLGLVAGMLMSELFVVFIPATDAIGDGDGSMASPTYLLKPILAILGGFSANLVYRILNRLIEAVESIFRGSTDEIVAQKQDAFELRSQAMANRLRNAAVKNLLTLKQQLVAANTSQVVLDQLDEALEQAKGPLAGVGSPASKGGDPT